MLDKSVLLKLEMMISNFEMQGWVMRNFQREFLEKKLLPPIKGNATLKAAEICQIFAKIHSANSR